MDITTNNRKYPKPQPPHSIPLSNYPPYLTITLSINFLEKQYPMGHWHFRQPACIQPQVEPSTAIPKRVHSTKLQNSKAKISPIIFHIYTPIYAFPPSHPRCSPPMSPPNSSHKCRRGHHYNVAFQCRATHCAVRLCGKKF